MRSVILATSFLLLFACSEDDKEVHVMVTQAPPATATAGAAFDVSWQVHNETDDDLHHSELRYCPGANVTDCGMGETDSFTSVTGAVTEGTFLAAVTIDAVGAYTLVAWCHVGDNPHLSDIYNIDVQ